jgi:hypothetical protein
MARNETLSEVDREAMQRAIDLTRAEGPDRVRWLEGRTFTDSGALCAYHRQHQALQLRPWEWAPSWIEPGDIDTLLSAPSDLSGKHRAAELCKRLLTAGLSRFEPNPLDALERAEKAKPKSAA